MRRGHDGRLCRSSERHDDRKLILLVFEYGEYLLMERGSVVLYILVEIHREKELEALSDHVLSISLVCEQSVEYLFCFILLSFFHIFLSHEDTRLLAVLFNNLDHGDGERVGEVVVFFLAEADQFLDEFLTALSGKEHLLLLDRHRGDP